MEYHYPIFIFLHKTRELQKIQRQRHMRGAKLKTHRQTCSHAPPLAGARCARRLFLVGAVPGWQQ